MCAVHGLDEVQVLKSNLVVSRSDKLGFSVAYDSLTDVQGEVVRVPRLWFLDPVQY